MAHLQPVNYYPHFTLWLVERIKQNLSFASYFVDFALHWSVPTGAYTRFLCSPQQCCEDPCYWIIAPAHCQELFWIYMLYILDFIFNFLRILLLLHIYNTV